MQDPGHDDLAPVAANRQGQGLVAVRGAGHREAAPVRAPERGCPCLGVRQRHVGMLNGVDSAVQGNVASDDGASQVLTLLVPGNRHRRELACRGLGGEAQPPG